MDEIGLAKETGRTMINISKKYFRPCEVDLLLGSASKAENELGWKRHYSLDELIEDVFESDIM